MRTVWTMGFVAAAALSFCFPDFIVFRFTQAVIWAIALVGLVILCGIERSVLLRPGRLLRHRRLHRRDPGRPYAALALLGARARAAAWATPPATASAGSPAAIACGPRPWSSYAFAIAFPQLLRWRLIEQWTGGVQGLYLDFPTPPGDLLSNDRWGFLMALALLGGGPVAGRQPHRTAAPAGR